MTENPDSDQRLDLWLIRHGETDWNRQQRWQGQSDTPLSDQGIAQARALAERLAQEQFDGVFSSDLKRAADTARLALPDCDLLTDIRLREMDFGEFEGKSYHDLLNTHGDTIAQWRRDPHGFRAPNGESYMDLHQRVVDWRADLPPSGRYAAFLHGGTIRALLYAVTGVPVDNTWAVRVDNASISVLKRFGELWVLHGLNDTAHLPEPPLERS